MDGPFWQLGKCFPVTQKDHISIYLRESLSKLPKKQKQPRKPFVEKNENGGGKPRKLEKILLISYISYSDICGIAIVFENKKEEIRK